MLLLKKENQIYRRQFTVKKVQSSLKRKDNPLWGCHRIADELKKIGIDLHPTTVNKIVQTFRKQGKIQPTGGWNRFLEVH